MAVLWAKCYLTKLSWNVYYCPIFNCCGVHVDCVYFMDNDNVLIETYMPWRSDNRLFISILMSTFIDKNMGCPSLSGKCQSYLATLSGKSSACVILYRTFDSKDTIDDDKVQILIWNSHC